MHKIKMDRPNEFCFLWSIKFDSSYINNVYVERQSNCNLSHVH